MRSSVRSAVLFALSQEDFRGEVKGYLSSALGRVGNPIDMADIMEMIRADMERMRQGRAAMASGDRSAKARGSSTSWAGWHVEALVRLGNRDSEGFLLELLHEPEYEVDAAWALHVTARNSQPDPNAVIRARFVPTGRDFRTLRSGAAEWRARLDEHFRAKHAAAIRERVLDLYEESKSSDPKSIPHYHHRIKELAKVLAALDPQQSANLIMEIAALPARSDGWQRVALLEALVFAGVALPMNTALAVIAPVIAQFRANGIYGDNGASLSRILSLLPFVDDPQRGIECIREIVAEFRFIWHGNSDLLIALAQCRHESGLTYLTEIAEGLNDNAFHQIAREWLAAVASCTLPPATAVMLSFLDPDAPPGVGRRTLPDHAIDFIAGRLSDLAQTDASVAERIVKLTATPISGQQRMIIAKVIAQMNSATALLAGLNLIDDASAPSVPFEIFRALEDVVLEKRPIGGDSQSYTLAPRGGNDIKARLFEMSTHDPRRAESARMLLAQIEEWRIEYGRPPSEPRHPDFDSGEMWPPIH